MKKSTLVFGALLTCTIPFTSFAGVVSSTAVIEQQLSTINKQSLLEIIDSAEVQKKLIELGVNAADAKARINNLTDVELAQLNQQINDAPAGSGIVGTIVTVLVVVAVLDLLGITDAYTFIEPI